MPVFFTGEMRKLYTGKASEAVKCNVGLLVIYGLVPNSVCWYRHHFWFCVVGSWCWQMLQHLFIHAAMHHSTPFPQLCVFPLGLPNYPLLSHSSKGHLTHPPTSQDLLVKLVAGGVCLRALPNHTHSVLATLLPTLYGGARNSQLPPFTSPEERGHTNHLSNTHTYLGALAPSSSTGSTVGAGYPH